jgi:uncharacterized protein
VWFGKGRRQVQRKAAQPPQPAAAQAMVRCAHCGVHLPRQDAFIDDAGRLFCGAEHRHLGPRTGGSA